MKTKTNQNDLLNYSSLQSRLEALPDTIKDQERIIRKSAEEQEKVEGVGKIPREKLILLENNDELFDKEGSVSGGNIKESVGGAAEVTRSTSERIISAIRQKLDNLPKAETVTT